MGQAPDREELGSHAEAVEFIKDNKEQLMVFGVVQWEVSCNWRVRCQQPEVQGSHFGPATINSAALESSFTVLEFKFLYLSHAGTYHKGVMKVNENIAVKHVWKIIKFSAYVRNCRDIMTVMNQDEYTCRWEMSLFQWHVNGQKRTCTMLCGGVQK